MTKRQRKHAPRLRESTHCRDLRPRRIRGRAGVLTEPGALPAGQMIVWHNVGRTMHRVVLNKRSVDTADLALGASTRPMAIAGGQYHRSIHHVMVGSINQDTSPPPALPGTVLRVK
jgi:hypothetical protein